MEKGDPNEKTERMTNEVIMNTILLDNEIRDHIIFFMGLHTKTDNIGTIIKNENAEIVNRMYEELGALTKLEIFKEILKKENINELKDLDNLFRDLYKIRNIFAHSIFPKQYSKERNKQMDIPNFPELHKKHFEIYHKLMDWFYHEVMKIEGLVVYD